MYDHTLSGEDVCSRMRHVDLTISNVRLRTLKSPVICCLLSNSVSRFRTYAVTPAPSNRLRLGRITFDAIWLLWSLTKQKYVVNDTSCL